ncbi:hypothetical protein IAR50_002647 [Cryptococcus sp. DSM 104548]
MVYVMDVPMYPLGAHLTQKLNEPYVSTLSSKSRNVGKPSVSSKGKRSSSTAKHYKHHTPAKAAHCTFTPGPAYKAYHVQGSTKVTNTPIPQRWAAGHLEGSSKRLIYRTPAEETSPYFPATSTITETIYIGAHLGGTRVRITPCEWTASHLASTSKVRLSLAPIRETFVAPRDVTRVTLPTSLVVVPSAPLLASGGGDWVTTHLGGTKETLAAAVETPTQWDAYHVGGTKVSLFRTAAL